MHRRSRCIDWSDGKTRPMYRQPSVDDDVSDDDIWKTSRHRRRRRRSLDSALDQDKIKTRQPTRTRHRQMHESTETDARKRHANRQLNTATVAKYKDSQSNWQTDRNAARYVCRQITTQIYRQTDGRQAANVLWTGVQNGTEINRTTQRTTRQTRRQTRRQTAQRTQLRQILTCQRRRCWVKRIQRPWIRRYIQARSPAFKRGYPGACWRKDRNAISWRRLIWTA